jgi:peptide/nickel transport system permease protein
LHYIAHVEISGKVFQLAENAVLEVEDSAQDFAQRTPKQIAWMRFRRNKVGVVSAWVAIFFIAAAILAPIIIRLLGLSNVKTYPETLNDYAMPIGKFGGMSLKHPLGVEPGAGRDVLSLLLYGSRISYTVAVITSVASIGLGMLIGVTTGYFRGRVDAIVGRFSDFLLSFPGTFMIIALSLPLTQRVEALGIARDNGARIVVLVVFFVFFGWPGFARLIRSQAMSMRERDFVMAAQAMGASSWRIITKELLPNLWPTAIVFLSLSLPGFLSAEAVFSFLGVGVQAPASTFGLVLADAVGYWRDDPAYLLIPSIMLVIIVLSLNLLGDAIRDALDPKSSR